MELKLVHVVIDRPIGYVDKFGNIYPINYGYIPTIMGGDHEEQDAYILDVDYPIEEYYGKVIAIVYRNDDVETKWIVSNTYFSKKQIWDKIYFMEKHFDSYIKLIKKVED